MTGPLPPAGSLGPWSGGETTDAATCLLAPNASPMTLDGTNTWIIAVAGGRDALVIDPGPDDDNHLAAIAAHLGERELRPGVIVLTHGHPDHSEGAAHLGEVLGCQVRAVDPTHRLGEEGLIEGAVIAGDGFECAVVSTPGHSADSVSLILRSQDGVGLLTGDTVLGRGTTVVAHPEGRLVDYLASLRTLRDISEKEGASTVLTGHGPALSDPIGVIDYYLDHRAQRLAQVAAAVESAGVAPQQPGPDDLADWIVERVYADVPRSLWPAAVLSVRAQLEYLSDNATR